jgi:hypothetical protein
MKKILLIAFTVIPGIMGVTIFGHFALQDWKQLQQAYAIYRQVSTTSSDMLVFLNADAGQMIQRINLFADGTRTLLSAILAAIGFQIILSSD